MELFASVFNINDETSILDIGGHVDIWKHLPVKPHIIIGNIYETDRTEDNFTFREMDGTALPYKDNHFEIVFSNSVIEHLGSWENQKRFASEIKRTGKAYFVQTPNKYFPVEPHFLTPIIHLLPQRAYRKLLPVFSPWYWMQRPTRGELNRVLDEIQLLDESQMRELFPEATIILERFMGMTKSIIALKTDNGSDIQAALKKYGSAAVNWSVR